MLFFSEQQVRELADADTVISSIRAAFARDFSATLRMPVRTTLELSNGSVMLLMPCYDSGLDAAGVKIVTVSRAAGVNASYELLDPGTGLALARMEANYLTDLRTAATSAVATDLLARPDAETLGVFGSGRQALAHLSVISRVRRFRRLLVCGSGRSDLRPFLARMSAEHGIEAEPADAQRCASESDVICTCTTACSPLFDGAWLRAGAHLNLVGAFQPETREVDDETMRRARIVVDTFQGALTEAGDLLIPLASGAIRREHILAELHQVASGGKQPRASRNDITLFKSVGCALEDLVTAKLIFQRAME
jgi:ornithine cyclodeaminase/alanine dehydrogenase-like protein (mu-crystallin family)